MVGPLGQPVRGQMGLVKNKIAMIEMAPSKRHTVSSPSGVMPATAQHLEQASLSWMP